MFDFMKKKPLLFKMEVMLDPANDNVLMEGCQVMSLEKDGTALSKKKKAGKVWKPAWDYITGFCVPDQMRRTDFNKFEIEVRGEADKSDVFPDPYDHPYIFRCGHVKKYPHMLPHTEYHCGLADKGDHLDIIVHDEKIGAVKDSREGRIDKIRGMLQDGFQPTAQIEPDPHSCGIFVIMRKV